MFSLLDFDCFHLFFVCSQTFGGSKICRVRIGPHSRPAPFPQPNEAVFLGLLIARPVRNSEISPISDKLRVFAGRLFHVLDFGGRPPVPIRQICEVP